MVLHGRELHTNAHIVESASFTAMNSWSIRDCTLEKTLTSALSVERPLGGALTCQLTGAHSAQKQPIFVSNVGIASNQYRTDLDTDVFETSQNLRALSAEKALRICTCWVSMS